MPDRNLPGGSVEDRIREIERARVLGTGLLTAAVEFADRADAAEHGPENHAQLVLAASVDRPAAVGERQFSRDRGEPSGAIERAQVSLAQIRLGREVAHFGDVVAAGQISAEHRRRPEPRATVAQRRMNGGSRIPQRTDRAGARNDDAPGRAVHVRHFRTMSEALLPPNAYALFIATSTRVARETFGT